MYILKQLFFSISVNSGRIFTEPRSGEVNILPLFTEIGSRGSRGYNLGHENMQTFMPSISALQIANLSKSRFPLLSQVE